MDFLDAHRRLVIAVKDQDGVASDMTRGRRDPPRGVYANRNSIPEEPGKERPVGYQC